MSQPVDTASVAAPPRHQRVSTYLTILLLLVAIAVLVLYLIPENEYVLLPGEALPVAPMISVPGHPPKHTRGVLYLTDVSLYKADHLLEDLFFRLNSDADFEPAQTVSGPLNESQYNQLNISLMSESIHQAEAAALDTIPGFHPHFASTGPQIIYVLPGTPAAKVLRAGDVVLDVNGRRTRRAGTVAPAVHVLAPGDVARLTILRGKRTLTESVKTVPSTNGEVTPHGKTPLIGIDLMDQIVFPVHLSVNPGNIGGPSGGLMFSLGIIERLGPTDITHGCRIAGTGTMDDQGNVGEIGGAKQKIIAARHAGAQYFLVPDVPDNLQPALANRGSIKVVPVKTLRQALDYLRGIKACP